MAKPILISGIQPSGRLHIGNYLGAIRNFVEFQNSNEYDCFFFIADLHALTEEIDPKERTWNILDLTASYMNLGLNEKKSTIFLQSMVPAHTELAWILNTMTPMGELSRMTQFKDKKFQSALLNVSGKIISGTNNENTKQIVEDEVMEYTNVGLFTYPTLMAADILLYDTTLVPVGEDQIQHLELARMLARKFNKKFGNVFVEPQPRFTATPRIMSLDDPTKKMSKSRPQGCLFLDDSPEEIQEKMSRAVTDSESEIRYDPEKKPGISNLLRILSVFSGKLIPDLEKDFFSSNYSELKLGLAQLIIKRFEYLQTHKNDRLKNPKKIFEILEKGSKKANRIAIKKIIEVKKKIGIAL